MRTGSTEDAVQSAEWGCYVLHDAKRGPTKERRPRQPRLENGTIEHATGGSSQELRGRVARALSHPGSPISPVSEQAERQRCARARQGGTGQAQHSRALPGHDREQPIAENAGACRDKLIHGRRSGPTFGIRRLTPCARGRWRPGGGSASSCAWRFLGGLGFLRRAGSVTCRFERKTQAVPDAFGRFGHGLDHSETPMDGPTLRRVRTMPPFDKVS